MKNVVIAALGLTAGLMALQCTHNEKKADPGRELVKWHGKMHVLSDSLSKLLPLTVSQRAFNDPKNERTITDETKRLMAAAHAVDMTADKPTHDPGVNFTSQGFAANMTEAVFQLDQENRPYARRLIQTSTAYCISCHTRTDQGRAELQLSALADLTGLSSLEKADYYMAVRDYDKALAEFYVLMNSPDAQIQNPFMVEVAAEKILAIAVRVKKSPDLAMDVANRIIDGRWAPIYLRLNALTWKRAIGEWKKSEAETAIKLTANRQLDLAERLTRMGWKGNTETAYGHAGLVSFLRASGILHDFLGQSPAQKRYGEALYWAGLTAESLRDLNLNSLQDAYYESCVRHSPRTALAKKCYLRLEALQMAAYHTDEGMRLPERVRSLLMELRNLSEGRQDRLEDWDILVE
jgi:hypothetical protein